MSIEHALEALLVKRARERYGIRGATPEAIHADRVRLAELLIKLLDEAEPHPAPPPVEPEAPPEPEAPVVKEQPTREILERAIRIQTLAMQSTSEHEREAAWAQFAKLWNKYELPNNLGMETWTRK